MPKTEKQKIVWAGDLPLCEMCEEPWCPTCEAHYADCACPGPCTECQHCGEVFDDCPCPTWN